MQIIPNALKSALWGAVGGAVALTIIGFTWGGWVTGSKAEFVATKRASEAVVAALAPICVYNFRQGADAPAQRVKLTKVNVWNQAEFVEKGGWAKMPGTTSINMAMARACAEMILADKS